MTTTPHAADVNPLHHQRTTNHPIGGGVTGTDMISPGDLSAGQTGGVHIAANNVGDATGTTTTRTQMTPSTGSKPDTGVTKVRGPFSMIYL